MKAGLPVQAVYSVGDLAGAAGITTRRMRRLLKSCRVETFRAGRGLWVGMDELREKIPEFWRNVGGVGR
jgi:hypothetical protein